MAGAGEVLINGPLGPGAFQEVPLAGVLVKKHRAARADMREKLLQAGAIGAVEVTLTPGATAGAANLYAGGVMVINDATGEGYTYKIKSHPAITASTDFVITLEDPLIVALDATSEVTLVHNQYNGLIIHPVTETGGPVGIGIYAITALYFGWIKTKGVVALLQDAATGGLGTSVAASTTTAGAGTLVVAGLKEIGTMMATGVSTEYNPIFLDLT